MVGSVVVVVPGVSALASCAPGFPCGLGQFTDVAWALRGAHEAVALTLCPSFEVISVCVHRHMRILCGLGLAPTNGAYLRLHYLRLLVYSCITPTGETS
ncbi:hypothetical protein D3C81_1494450 [compost metagenome]